MISILQHIKEYSRNACTRTEVIGGIRNLLTRLTLATDDQPQEYVSIDQKDRLDSPLTKKNEACHIEKCTEKRRTKNSRITALVSMGYEPELASKALSLTSNDIESAIYLLLEHPTLECFDIINSSKKVQRGGRKNKGGL